MNNLFIPNSTQLPNIIIDYWMPRLTDGEFKVLIAIARKTYGWRKKSDTISLRQIEEMTGLSRKGITKMLDSLIAKTLIIKIKSKTEWGDDAPNIYEINTECEVNDEMLSVGRRSELSSLPVVNSVHHGVVYSVHPQKIIYTKDNIQKREEAFPPPAPAFSFFSGENEKTINTSKSLDLTGNRSSQQEKLQHKVNYRNNNDEIKVTNIEENNKKSNNSRDFKLKNKEKSSVQGKEEKAKHVHLSKEEHTSLVKRYGNEAVVKFYSILSEWKQDTPRSKWKKSDYRSILRWVVNASSEKQKWDATRNDPKRNEEISKRLNKFKLHDVVLGHDYVEFINGPTCTHLKYDDKNFQEKFLKEIVKRNIDIEVI